MRQHWQVMPGIIDGPVAAAVPSMLGDDLVAEAHNDAVGIGADLDGPPRRLPRGPHELAHGVGAMTE